MGHVIEYMSEHNSLTDFITSPHSKLPYVCQGCILGKKIKAIYLSKPLKKCYQLLGEFFIPIYVEKCYMHL